MSDESDSEEHYYSGSEEGDESNESDSDGANHGLLDLEASEGSSDSESDADHFSGHGSYADYSFPKFRQLPPEIREMVWAAFCPDIGSEPRVFELRVHTTLDPAYIHLPSLVDGIVAGPQIEAQTEPMRTMMAVHRESRALGLKSAPHEFALTHGEVVHYHQERDVLFIEWEEEIVIRGIALRFQELGIDAQNLAFPPMIGRDTPEDLADLMYLLPQVKRLFILEEEGDLKYEGISVRHYAWAVSEMVHRYRLDTEEETESGLSHTLSRIFCWPDLDNHSQYAEEHVIGSEEGSVVWTAVKEYRDRLTNPLEDSRELTRGDLSDEEQTEAVERLQSIEVWPMVRFNFEEGLRRFRDIETRVRLFPYEMFESESSHSETEDEYESEGIDDDPIDDSSSIDDDDELLIHNLGLQSHHSHGSSSPEGIADDPIDDDDQLLAQNLAHGLFRPNGSSSRLVDNSSDIEELAPANFSSDEEGGDQAHVTITSGSENESGTQSHATRRKRRVVTSDSDESSTETEKSPRPSKQRRRAAILDSEDDNEEASSDAERARGSNRQVWAVTIDSDSDDQGDGEPSRAGPRRGRAISGDSEDNDEEEAQQPSAARKPRRRVVQEESDDEVDDGESDSQGGGAKMKDSSSSDEGESSSDDEDDEPPPPKRMSLAKRLSMESRQARPRHVEDDDSEADGMNGDGYGYSDDEEDGVDKSDSDMMAGVAGFSGSEDGESEGGY